MIGVVFVVILVPTLVVAAGALYLGISMGNTATADIFQSSTSPDGKWTVRCYDHNPGAAGHEWYSANLVDNAHHRRTREVFRLEDSGDALWTKDGSHIRIRWLSSSLVSIGGHDVNVLDGHWSDDLEL
jgi:hypothetical protein